MPTAHRGEELCEQGRDVHWVAHVVSLIGAIATHIPQHADKKFFQRVLVDGRKPKLVGIPSAQADAGDERHPKPLVASGSNCGSKLLQKITDLLIEAIEIRTEKLGVFEPDLAKIVVELGQHTLRIGG